MTAPLSKQQLAERCVCAATSVQDRTVAEHAVWCPSRKPTSERIAEVKAGSGRPLMDGELEWLRGDASRAELHISGSRAGAFPMTDDLPGFVVELAQKLAAVVAELDRTRVALSQSENDLTGARLSLWEEEQETRSLREERHSTNESLDDAVRELRVLVAHRAPITDSELAALSDGPDVDVYEPLLRRLLDAEAEAGRLRARAVSRDEHVDRLTECLVDRTIDVQTTEQRVAELEAALSTATAHVAEQDSDLGGWSARVADLEARLRRVGMATTYRLESGKGFVYVEDIADAVFGRPTAGGAR